MDFHKLDNWKKLPELKSLLDLSTPPKELFYIGTWDPELYKNCVAVVGSRKMTSYGEQVIEKLIPYLIHQNKTVVSGFMYGVDQYAHERCVEGGGKTIAVLGWGIDTKLTGIDLVLAKKIIDSGGLIISEWETQKPSHWTFPARNRIVAALCKELIVVEAAEKSGSLITAKLASKLNRKLWAVPGSITSRTSKGTNQLIALGKAEMWTGGISHQQSASSLQNLDDPVLNALENESLTADEIARKLSLPVSEIGSKLTLLLLSGQIGEKGGKYYLENAD